MSSALEELGHAKCEGGDHMAVAAHEAIQVLFVFN